MTALLDLPTVRERIKPVSVADYHRLTEGEPTELLRGMILEKMSKSPLHQDTVDDLREILQGQIQPAYRLRQEGPLTLADSEPEPDLSVTLRQQPGKRRGHPSTAELVIEVAVSSLEIDRVKALIYAEADVKEYWIVCPEERQVEVYLGPRPEGYATQTVIVPPSVLESTALAGVRVDLGAFFARGGA